MQAKKKKTREKGPLTSTLAKEREGARERVNVRGVRVAPSPSTLAKDESREILTRSSCLGERERESSHFGSSAAPLLGGLLRLLASGGRHGVTLRLCPQGSSRCLSQRCLS